MIPILAPGTVSSFQDLDIEKTVMIPGYSSFLIINVLDDKNAIAVATMPTTVLNNMTFPKDSWFLYNLGHKNGRMWEIYAKPCNYWFQQHDDSLSLSVLKYIDLGKSYTVEVKVIPNTKGKLIFYWETSKGDVVFLEYKIYTLIFPLPLAYIVSGILITV